MSTPVSSFLDGSSSFLQLTRTTIKAWMSSNFKQAFEHLEKFAYTYNEHSSAFIFEWIFLILVGNIDNHKIRQPSTKLAALERLKYSCIML